MKTGATGNKACKHIEGCSWEDAQGDHAVAAAMASVPSCPLPSAIFCRLHATCYMLRTSNVVRAVFGSRIRFPLVKFHDSFLWGI